MLKILLSLALAAQAEPPPTPLQKALNDMEPRGDWHYNDLDAGFAEARRAGKPLCVVFR